MTPDQVLGSNEHANFRSTPTSSELSTGDIGSDNIGDQIVLVHSGDRIRVIDLETESAFPHLFDPERVQNCE